VPVAFTSRIARNIACTIDRRQSERRLVEQQQLRLRHQRAADRDHLLLAAGECARRRVELVAHGREQRADALERAFAAPRGQAQVAADLQFSRTVMPREQPPTFRHDRDPGGAEAMGGDAVISQPSIVMLPARARLSPASASISVVLPRRSARRRRRARPARSSSDTPHSAGAAP
jgi:hypothetical protein